MLSAKLFASNVIPIKHHKKCACYLCKKKDTGLQEVEGLKLGDSVEIQNDPYMGQKHIGMRGTVDFLMHNTVGVHINTGKIGTKNIRYFGIKDIRKL